MELTVDLSKDSLRNRERNIFLCPFSPRTWFLNTTTENYKTLVFSGQMHMGGQPT